MNGNNNDTHIFQNFPSTQTTLLVRRSDGMVLAGRKVFKVGFGEDPREQQRRVFLDEHYAAKFLRFLADIDYENQLKAKGEHIAEGVQCVARITEVDAEPRIVSANEAVGNGRRLV